jgi:hypothetical protein
MCESIYKQFRDMKNLISLALATFLLAGCSSNHIDSISLSNEDDSLSRQESMLLGKEKLIEYLSQKDVLNPEFVDFPFVGPQGVIIYATEREFYSQSESFKQYYDIDHVGIRYLYYAKLTEDDVEVLPFASKGGTFPEFENSLKAKIHKYKSYKTFRNQFLIVEVVDNMNSINNKLILLDSETNKFIGVIQ